jgi:hypothetical protein
LGIGCDVLRGRWRSYVTAERTSVARLAYALISPQSEPKPLSQTFLICSGAPEPRIAAHALADNLAWVTNNERGFKRVPRLKIENWTKKS